MMKKGRWNSLFLTLAVGLMTTGCGAAVKDAAANAAAPAEAYEMAYEEAYDTSASYASSDIYTGGAQAKAEESGEADAGEGGTEVYSTQRKLIKNVNLNVETETFDDLLANVEEKTRKAGGYIEQSYTYNGSSYYGGGRRNASLTIRIPAENLDEFLSAVSAVSNVISRNESVSDVTLQYVDLESHKKALLAEQDRLLELLDVAETIEDIISLESRLSEVRYQIESMESQLRTMDNQVSYITIELYIDEVEKLTPVQEQTAWQKISVGFANSLHNVGNGLVNFGIGLIISLPYLMLWAAIILIIVLVCIIIIKISRKKTQKKGREQSLEQQKINDETVKK
ncbi:MAG: DUF4349 domain-containing protein [Lachnospiraceae bacterium]|nr:DUF4349 domain-containing protein [Lachnospiraceae bacterium]